MKHATISQYVPRAIFLASAILVGSACSGGGGSTDPDPVPQVTVSSVEVSATDDLIIPNQTTQATAVVKADNGSTLQRAVAWSSSDNAVASVASSGTVTGVAAGTAEITATSEGKSGRVSVTVVAPASIAADQFVLIQPGTFTMGPGGTGNPAHQVTITKSFSLQKTEVTQAEWRAVTGRSPSFFQNCDQCPVEQVSWADIQKFLKLLNAANPSAGYRLPTEAEWEYSCRAGTTGDYSGNGVVNDMGWTNANSQVPGGPQGTEDGRTWPVGQKLANQWGLFDMHGNVWEWVNDWFSATYYATSPPQDPLGPATGPTHVIRGGSWLNFPIFATSQSRAAGNELESERYKNVGFRLARAP